MEKAWISIKDKLPEVGIGILITDGQVIASAKLDTLHAKLGDLMWSGSGFCGYEWEFNFEDNAVTHWMPLPSLPSGDRV